MKRRNSFVANSSSSSFIIGIKDSVKTVDESLPKWASVMMENLLDYLSEDRQFTTKEEFDEYILENWGYDDSTIEEIMEDSRYIRDMYPKAVKALESGMTLIRANVENDDNWLIRFLGDLPEDNYDTEEMVLIEHSH